MIGGLGQGGSAIYALDVTNPSANNFIEGNAASLVKGEWDAASITCVGNATCGNNLGKTYGTPQIRRFHNGNWGAVFGNGFGSTSGDAGIYVMVVDHSSGAVTFYYLSTSTGSTANPNGIAYVAPADLDGDHISDYVYAGDLQGNVWRFDLTSTLATNWKVSTGPLFKTSSGQPITTQLVVSSAIVSGTLPQVIIGLGTGQRTQFTNTSSTSYASGTQSIYGVWDWNLAAWNALNSAAQYASLTGAQVAAYTKPALASPYTLGPSNLQLQTYTENGSTVTVTTTPIVWATCASSGSCTSSTPSFGWAVNLSGISLANAPTTEQIVANPNLYESAFLVNSTIPATNQPLSCSTPSTDEGIIYAISMTTGGTFVSGGSTSSPTYASAFEKYQDTQTVGLQTNETGAITVVNTVEGTTWVIGQNIAPNVGSAPGQAQQIQLPANTQVNRKTWVQLR